MKIKLSHGEILLAIKEYLSTEGIEVEQNDIILSCEWNQQMDSHPTDFSAETEFKIK